jgi:hypothetical protein
LLTGWTTCAPDGTQTRTIVSETPSELGCTAQRPLLVQACVYTPPASTCPEQTPNMCKVSDTLSMCCPAAGHFYCARLNVCLTDGMTADAYCGEAVTWCTI